MADSGIGSDGPSTDLANVPDFEIGGLRVIPARREISRDGTRSELQPRVMKVLVALAKAGPDVVSRDRLVEQCWDGRIVSDDAINRCILALRQAARQFSPEPFAIETVPRVGYALIEAKPGNASTLRSRLADRRIRIVAVAALVVLAAAVWALARWATPASDPGPASIAVLPFRNLSEGDSYFADGLGDELIGQLAQEPQFRVSGRVSASQFADKSPEFVGRRLNVDYVLDGSVRRQGSQVRVSSALVRTADGVQLWSNKYSGNLDDIFAIQQRISTDIAGALSRRLGNARPKSGPLVTTGEAYKLYLTARGLLRTRDPDLMSGATVLLNDAIRLDPGFAPAWSSLAQATRFAAKDHERVIADMPQAQRYARHAIKLAPQLAEAHATLGMLLGLAAPDARTHLARAARLEPNNPEYQVWLASSRRASGNYPGALAAYRRAYELDPGWPRTTRDLTVSMTEMGNRSEAEEIARRASLTDDQRNAILGRIAWAAGDLAGAARHWSSAASSETRSALSQLSGMFLEDAKFELGLPGKPLPQNWPPNYDGRLENRRVRMTAAPTPGVWKTRNRSAIAALVYQKENRVGAKLMLLGGRARELVGTFDGPAGLLGLRQGQHLRADLLNEAPTIALALRGEGRDAEANRLLREADELVRGTYRRGPVPPSFDAEAAAIWAAQGRYDEALGALERAVGRNWMQLGDSDLSDLADEPGFLSLRGHPRFEKFRERLQARRRHERSEIERLRI